MFLTKVLLNGLVQAKEADVALGDNVRRATVIKAADAVKALNGISPKIAEKAVGRCKEVLVDVNAVKDENVGKDSRAN